MSFDINPGMITPTVEQRLATLEFKFELLIGRMVELEAKLEKFESVWEHIAALEAKVAAPHERLEALRKLQEEGWEPDADQAEVGWTIEDEASERAKLVDSLVDEALSVCQPENGCEKAQEHTRKVLRTRFRKVLMAGDLTKPEGK